MKKIRILFLMSIFIMCFVGNALSEQIPQIPSNSLNYSSRYIFQIKDASNNFYNIYIVPKKESKLENWIWGSKSDKIFQGEYFIFMSESSSNTAFLQSVYPFGSLGKNSLEGIFNLSKQTFQNRAFILQSSIGKPDVLCIAQQLTGSGDSLIRAFYVDSGVLKIIHWKNNDGRLLNSVYSDGFHPLKYTNIGTITVPSWQRSPNYSGGIVTTWEFFPETQTCIFKEANKIKYTE